MGHPGLDHRVELGNLVFPNEVSHRRNAHHDLVGRHPAAADPLEQGLGNDSPQGFGQHGANHVLLRAGEDVDDTVYGLGRRRGVQGAEHQVTGFGRGHGKSDGLEVPHLAHQNDVRVFTQGRTQGGAETLGIAVHFPLVDQTALVLVHEFDGILDGKDVVMEVLIDVVDHGRQGGGFARAGRARHQHQTPWEFGNLAKYLGGIKILKAQYRAGDGTKHGAGSTRLLEGVDPETRQIGHLEREVDLEIFLQLLALVVVHDVIDEGVHFPVLQGGQIDLANLPVNPDHRGNPGRQV